MKKKLLLIATGSLSFALAISTIALTTGANKKDNFVKGGGSPTGFDIDFSTIEHVGDDWTVSLKDNKGSSISITIVGANYDPVEDKFVAKGSGEDFYFYNTDPIRGISYSSFVVNQPNSNQYDLVAMLSSNQINLNDTLDGYATEDFAYFTESYYKAGDKNIAMDVASMPLLANARYFVVHLNPTSEDFSVIDMHLESICEDEVTPQPIVERDGTLTEAEQTQLGEMFAHQLELTKMGHPTWCFSRYGNYIYDSYKNGTSSALFTTILNSGFVHTGDLEGYQVYQKKVASTVHSIAVLIVRGNYLNTITCLYTDTYPCLATEATWPSDYLATVLTPEHAAQISEFASSYITGYTYTYGDNTQAEETQIYIIPILTPSITEEQISEIAQAFKDLYDAKSGWTKRTDSSSSVIYAYEDNYLGIAIECYSTVVSFVIQEINPRSETPTSSEIAKQINALTYVDDVVALVGDEHSTYITDFTTPVPPNRSYCYYTIIDPISGSFETFKGLLEAAGYSLVGDSTTFYEYGKVVDVYGSSISVNVSVEGPNIHVRYNYNYNIREYNSLAEALYYIFYHYLDVLKKFCSELIFDDSYEYWGITSSSKRVLVKNAGSELIEQFATNSHLTYIPAYDGYRIDDTSRVLYASINGSDVEIIIKNQSRFEFDDYEDYNTGLNGYIVNNGSLVEDNYVPFVEADNTLESFTTGSSNRYYYLGSETEITRVRDLYAERILEKPNFVYSEYLNMYVNTETGFAYELNLKSDEKVLEIKWNLYVRYEDFDSFNNLNMGDSTFLQAFPALVDNSRKDEKLFIDFFAYEIEAYVYVKKGDIIEDYIDELLDAGFSNVENRYTKQIGSAVYQVFIREETNAYFVYFFMEDGYQSISDFRSHITNETLTYVDGLGFNSFFTSTTPSYRLVGEGDHILEFKTTKFNEAQAYEAYIVSNGFKLDYGHRYIRESSTDVYDTINFEYRGAYCYIRIEQYSVTFNYSWSQLADVLTSHGHDHEFLKDYVCYPDDVAGTIFNFINASTYNAEFTVSKSFDLEAFDVKCKTHPEFKQATDYGNYISYSFTNGYVNVEIEDFQYRFNVYCPVEKPIDPTGAIPVSLGETPISITGVVKYFEFTASEDGRYDITTISGVDTYGYLYDENGKKLAFNDDDGEDSNFLIEAKLQAGKTYYIGVRLFSSGEEDVTLSITYKGL